MFLEGETEQHYSPQFAGKYVAASEATKEALNLRMLLHHLGFGDPRPTDIFVDNKGAITMGLHPSNKPATRPVDMRVHMLRQRVELGHVSNPLLSDLRHGC